MWCLTGPPAPRLLYQVRTMGTFLYMVIMYAFQLQPAVMQTCGSDAQLRLTGTSRYVASSPMWLSVVLSTTSWVLVVSTRRTAAEGLDQTLGQGVAPDNPLGFRNKAMARRKPCIANAWSKWIGSGSLRKQRPCRITQSDVHVSESMFMKAVDTT